jgi:hypothetical protein
MAKAVPFMRSAPREDGLPRDRAFRTRISGVQTQSGERGAKTKKPLTDLQAFGIIMLCFAGLATAGVAVLALGAWLAWNSHDFSPRDLRYLLFVRGTLLERIGVIDAEAATLRYGGQGRDGNAPGYTRANYKSKLEPVPLLTRFATRCEALGLRATWQEHRPGESFRTVSCGRLPDDDFPVHMSVDLDRPDGLTRVGMIQDSDDGL